MKTNFFLLVILSIITTLTFFMCDSVTTTDPKDESYFPLKVNNTWYYYTNYSDLSNTTKISKTIVVNSKEYFLYSVLNYENAVDTIRMEGNKIYRLTNNVPVLWLNLNAADKEQYTYGSYLVTVKKNISVNTKAGKFNNCIDVSFDIPQAVDDEYGFTFAKGVGIVEMHSAWFDFLLDSYNFKSSL